ncbi:TonB-dependent receptor [Dissulfuribacter thermophilus]|uniref:TonB-dependent receptor n=1 Tax=Dissulfuribacter thermophilus TaxID=1156395 RepID=A0A1B9F3S4_9BACT|nr:TonB-dependent receptor [Dissulfuribacter thermophilus]OCC14589.1 TonB-dependent receptor [Dissulfuribacter thermophilus]
MNGRFLIVKLLLTTLIFLNSQRALAYSQAKEFLLFQEIPKVTSASRQVVNILESPATSSIITREDIIHSGYNSISELLRYVTGVNFFKNTESHFSIGIRGVNGLQASNVLVLVDGRPIFSPTRNTNQCSLIPEIPDDIERIEIIRGPGSVLYGSNAFSGIINIISRPPEAYNDTTVSISQGTFGDEMYNISTGKTNGQFAYKLLGSWRRKNFSADHEKPVEELLILSGEATYDFSPNSDLDFSFGFSNGKILFFPSSSLSPYYQKGFDGFFRTKLNHNDLTIDAWWRHFDTSGDFNFFDRINWYFDNLNLLVQHSSTLNVHKFVYGFETRFANLQATSYDRWHKQLLFSIFAEDKWKIDNKTNFFTGLRIDHHSEAGFAISPRFSLVFAITPSQSLRFTISRAFKYPSYLQNYIDSKLQFMSQTGNRELDPEVLTSAEIAYQIYNPSVSSLTVAAFFNKYRELIDTNVFLKNNRLNVSFSNQYDMYQYGFELEWNYRINANILFKTNYSYVWKQKKDLLTFGPVPTNQLNGEIRYEFTNDFWIDLRVHWQDKSDYTDSVKPFEILNALSHSLLPSNDLNYIYGLLAPSPSWQKLESFTLADLSFGYKPIDKEWSLVGAIHNLFHSTHSENPTGYTASTAVTVQIKYSF